MANCNGNVTQLVSTLTSLPRVFPAISEILSNFSNSTSVLQVTDQILQSWWWGAVIGIVCVGLLCFCCIFYCCVCCCVCCGEKKSSGKSYKCPKIGCGLFTVALLICSIVLISLVIWLETRVDPAINSFYSNVLLDAVLNGTSFNVDGSFIGQGLLQLVEFYRWRAGLAVAATALVLLLLSVLAFSCAPCCNSPAAIVIVMVLHVFLILLLALYACITFALTVFGSHICLDIYTSSCSASVAIGSPIQAFCTNTIMEMFAITLMLCAGALILFSLQLFGSIYARLISKSSDKQYKVETVNGQSSEMFISPPHGAGGTYMDGGVWDSYGTQSVMGVKSGGQNIPAGYTPEAYPMGAVAPVAPIAPLPMEGYDDVKEVTLHVHEVEASQLSMSDMYPSKV